MCLSSLYLILHQYKMIWSHRWQRQSEFLAIRYINQRCEVSAFIFVLTQWPTYLYCRLKKTNKKHSMRVVELNFIWGNMMTNLGDSTSGNSEKLFQRHRGKGENICDFGKGGCPSPTPRVHSDSRPSSQCRIHSDVNKEQEHFFSGRLISAVQYAIWKNVATMICKMN